MSNAQQKIYGRGEWQPQQLCLSCEKELSESDRFFNKGICPKCGHQSRGEIVAETFIRVRRWVSTSPWWKFWNPTGYWEYKKDGPNH